MSLQSTENWFQSGGGNFYDYPITKSLIFDDGRTQYLSRTPSSVGNQDTWTWSGWVKRAQTDAEVYLWSAGTSSTELFYIQLRSNSQGNILSIVWRDGSSTTRALSTTRKFRDASAYYHFVIHFNTGASTVTDRIKIFVNGVEETDFTTDDRTHLSASSSLAVNSTALHTIGRYAYSASGYMDGYIADVHFVDGQALNATSFGEFKSGVWKPIAYSGSYGTNGFHLEFDGNANDSSGNGNNWTENGGTAIASWQYVNDGPTRNFCRMTVLDRFRIAGSNVYSFGDLTQNGWGNPAPGFRASMGMKTGKWYWEFRSGYNYVDGMNTAVGIMASNRTSYTDTATNYGFYGYTGNKDQGFSWPGSAHFGASFATGDIYMIAFDADNGKIWFGKNGSWYNNGSTDGSANPATGTNPAYSNIDTDTYTFHPSLYFYDAYSSRPLINWNFGQNPTFSGNTTAGTNTDESTLGLFKYSVPSGFNCLCASNLPVSEFIDPAQDNSPQDHFKAITYTANNSSTNSLTGFGFSPDLFIAKMRSTNQSSVVGDTVRGDDVFVQTDTISGNTTSTNWITYGSDGVTLNSVYGNTGTYNYGAWAWEGGSSSVSNTSGTITSTVRANPDAGISIVSYTGNGTNGATIGHGLGATPAFFITKNTDNYNGSNGYNDWSVYHKDSPVYTGGAAIDGTARQPVWLHSTAAASNGVGGFPKGPTSTVFTPNQTLYDNVSNRTYIAYVFAEIPGFSSMGIYDGNSDASFGSFIYTGFRPAFVMFKAINSAQNWFIHDNARSPYNISNKVLLPNRGDLAEYTISNWQIDMLSNGFKHYNSDTQSNNSSYDYIYVAFAENPFAYANAR